MKYLLLLCFFDASACCWKRRVEPLPVTIVNVKELVSALNALQNANMAASISITPPPLERMHQVTPEPGDATRIDRPITNEMVTVSKLKKSHELIESFYIYPAAQEMKDKQ